jgi:hypothetical protein
MKIEVTLPAGRIFTTIAAKVALEQVAKDIASNTGVHTLIAPGAPVHGAVEVEYVGLVHYQVSA